MSEDRLMTLNEAAEYAKVHPATLRKAISKDKLNAKKHGRDWLVTESALQDWQKNQSHTPGRKPKA